MKYEEYLLSKLYECRDALDFNDYEINIAIERSFRMPKNPTGLLFIIKNLPGNYIYNIKTQPIQIIVYSELNDMTVAMQILDLFSKRYNNTSFEGDEGLYKQNYDSVVTLRPMLQSEAGFRASLYCYGTYVICEDVADVKDLLWYNSTTEEYEDIKYISAGFGYAAVLDTQKVAGTEISTSQKKEAGITLSINLPQTTNNFCKLIDKVMFGAVSGNTDFKFKFTLNGENYEITYKLSEASLPHNKVDAPTLQLSFSR